MSAVVAENWQRIPTRDFQSDRLWSDRVLSV